MGVLWNIQRSFVFFFLIYEHNKQFPFGYMYVIITTYVSVLLQVPHTDISTRKTFSRDMEFRVRPVAVSRDGKHDSTTRTQSDRGSTVRIFIARDIATKFPRSTHVCQHIHVSPPQHIHSRAAVILRFRFRSSVDARRHHVLQSQEPDARYTHIQRANHQIRRDYHRYPERHNCLSNQRTHHNDISQSRYEQRGILGTLRRWQHHDYRLHWLVWIVYTNLVVRLGWMDIDDNCLFGFVVFRYRLWFVQPSLQERSVGIFVLHVSVGKHSSYPALQSSRIDYDYDVHIQQPCQAVLRSHSIGQSR